MVYGVIPAKETVRDNKEFMKVIREFNEKHKANPACEKCCKLAQEKGRFTDPSKFQNMTKKRTSKVIIDKSQGNIIWGKMVDWECPDKHGMSFEYYPGESDDKNEVQK